VCADPERLGASGTDLRQTIHEPDVVVEFTKSQDRSVVRGDSTGAELLETILEVLRELVDDLPLRWTV
jgi:hypothetical protein